MAKKVKSPFATKPIANRRKTKKQKEVPEIQKTIETQIQLPPPAKTFNETNPYYHILNQVIDPEAGIGIVDMGLVYDVQEKDGIVVVTMTLTSMGCPAGPQLTTDVDGILRLEEGVKEVEINIVWEPAWTPDRMNPEIRTMLFGGF